MEQNNTNMPVVPSTDSKKTTSNKKSIIKESRNILLVGLLIILIVICFVLYNKSISVGAEILQKSYDEAYEDNKELITQYFYDKAEERFHVSNDVSISILATQEGGLIEVLNVSDTEFVISKANDNFASCEAWLQVPGTGVFTIDLMTAEFIVDDCRNHVSVRVPAPELTYVDSGVVTTLLVEGGKIINGNYEEGASQAHDNINQGIALLTKEFLSNQTFYDKAKESAKAMIINRVKQWNPEIEGLVVDVEFY